jgi:hypothetical protein
MLYKWHSICSTKTSRLILFSKIIYVSLKNHAKHISIIIICLTRWCALFLYLGKYYKFSWSVRNCPELAWIFTSQVVNYFSFRSWTTLGLYLNICQKAVLIRIFPVFCLFVIWMIHIWTSFKFSQIYYSQSPNSAFLIFCAVKTTKELQSLEVKLCLH